MSGEQLEMNPRLEKLKMLPGATFSRAENFKHGFNIRITDKAVWDEQAMPILEEVFGNMIYDTYAPDELKPFDRGNEEHRSEMQNQLGISFAGASEMYLTTDSSGEPVGFLPIEHYHEDEATAVFRDIIVNRRKRVLGNDAYDLLRMLYQDAKKNSVLAYTKDPRLIALAHHFGKADERLGGSGLKVSIGETPPTKDRDIDHAIEQVRNDLEEKGSLVTEHEYVPGFVFLPGDKHILPPTISPYSRALGAMMPVVRRMDELQQIEIDRGKEQNREPHAVAVIVVAVREKPKQSDVINQIRRIPGR